MDLEASYLQCMALSQNLEDVIEKAIILKDGIDDQIEFMEQWLNESDQE